MDTYRDDYAALQGQVDALRHELEDAKKSLEETEARATLHKKAAHAFEVELKRLRPGKPRTLAIVATAAFVGLTVGVLAESAIAGRRLKTKEQAFDVQMWNAQLELSDCRRRR